MKGYRRARRWTAWLAGAAALGLGLAAVGAANDLDPVLQAGVEDVVGRRQVGVGQGLSVP